MVLIDMKIPSRKPNILIMTGGGYNVPINCFGLSYAVINRIKIRL